MNKITLGLIFSLGALSCFAVEPAEDISEQKKLDSNFAMTLAVTIPPHLLACSVRYPELQSQIETVWRFEPSAKVEPSGPKTVLENCFKNNEVITKVQCESLLGILVSVAESKQWLAAQRQAYVDVMKVTALPLSRASKACWRAANP